MIEALVGIDGMDEGKAEEEEFRAGGSRREGGTVKKSPL